MVRLRTSFVASLLAAAASTLAADPNAKVVKTVVPSAYIFELADGQDAAALEQAVGKDGKTRMRLDFDLFKAVSVQLHNVDKAEEKATKLAALPQVKSVYPVTLYKRPNPKIEWIAQKGSTMQKAALTSRADGPDRPHGPHGPHGAYADTDTYSPHVMTQVDKLRAKGITGKGVRVALIDTGIDHTHPTLGACFGHDDCLVSFGTDLVGDDFNGLNTPHPDSDPMDCSGHGTHVAGIIAAQNNSYGFTGTAPDATLGIYRVFGCTGESTNEILMAAFNMAYQDGANIITASIGSASGWSEDPWAEAVSRIVKKGVPCVLSAGNDGEQGIFFASAAADGHRVAAIAAFDNVQTPIVYSNAKYEIDDGSDKVFGYLASKPANWDGVTLPAWASVLDPTVANDGCQPFPANTPDLSKYIVLIRRGGCDFDQKVGNAIAKGAKNVIVYNNAAGAVSMDLTSLRPGSLNAASMIDADTGATFIKALKEGKKLTLKMVSPGKTDSTLTTLNNTATGGALSNTTSWGPTWEMDLKPQFGAVGGNVLSTFPLALGGYAAMSGTSMACPQVAGIMALIHQVRGTYDPELMQNLLSGNSNPQLFNDGTKFHNFLAPVPQQGAGLVQAYDAAYATTVLSPSGLSFNDTDHFAKSLEFKLKNTDKKMATYRITHVPTITMYTLAKDSIYAQEFPNDYVDAAATLKFSMTSITLPGGEAETVTVSATPPEGLDAKRLALWSGYIVINGTDGASLSLPYQGLTGSLRSSRVLGPSDTWISKSTDEKARKVPPHSTFVIPGPGNASVNDTLPVLSANLALGSIKVRADIVPLTPCRLNDMTTCPLKDMMTEFWGVKTIGQPYRFPARWNTRGVNNWPWDGRLDSGNYAPPGKYQFVVRALRIFGDERKKEDWDVSTSPALTIEYQ